MKLYKCQICGQVHANGLDCYIELTIEHERYKNIINILIHEIIEVGEDKEVIKLWNKMREILNHLKKGN